MLKQITQLVEDLNEIYTAYKWPLILYNDMRTNTTINANFHDMESFTVDARELMDKFSLNSPKEILPYLKEHYNTPDCFYRIKKEFEV